MRNPDLTVENMSAELAAELARNEPRRKLIDPRDVVWRHFHLKAMHKSPAHCFESFQSETEQTLSMRLGSGAHALALGKPVALWDQPAANGKPGSKAPRNPNSEAFKVFKALNPNSVILNRAEKDKAERIVRSLRSHPDASRLLFSPGVIHEHSIHWEQNGRRRQTTPDAVGPNWVAELKSTKTADPVRFERDAIYRLYHAQVADQVDAVRSLGRTVEAAYVVAIESVEPYVCTVLRVTDRALDAGRKLNRLLLDRMCVCADSGEWPGYLQGIGDLDVPDDDPELIWQDSDEDDGDVQSEIVEGMR